MIPDDHEEPAPELVIGLWGRGRFLRQLQRLDEENRGGVDDVVDALSRDELSRHAMRMLDGRLTRRRLAEACSYAGATDSKYRRPRHALNPTASIGKTRRQLQLLVRPRVHERLLGAITARSTRTIVQPSRP